MLRSDEKPTDFLIIGLGSVLRTDDGVGPLVIQELRKHKIPRGVTLIEKDVCGLDLLKYFNDHDTVIIVDAAFMGLAPGSVTVLNLSWRASKDRALITRFQPKNSSGHSAGLIETIHLFFKLGFRNRLYIVGIEPYDTGFGTELSSKVQKAVPGAVKKVLKLLMSSGSKKR